MPKSKTSEDPAPQPSFTPGYQMSVSTRLDEYFVKNADNWAKRAWSDRSKILNAILHTVFMQINEQDGFSQSLDDVVRRIHLVPA